MLRFYKFLVKQDKRDDTVGYFARTMIESKKDKPDSSEYLDWYLFIEKFNSHQLIEDFNDAWEEYKKLHKK